MTRDLVSLSEYKLYAEISTTDSDTKLSSLISYISELVKNYCARRFIDNYDVGLSTFSNIIEYNNGGSDSIYLSEMPLLSIEKIEYSANGGESYTDLTNYTDYLFDRQFDKVLISGAENIEIANAFRITYKGGYSETPADLKLAVFDLIDYYRKKESAPKKSAGSVSVEYITSSDMPSHIKRVLDLYRVIR